MSQKPFLIIIMSLVLALIGIQALYLTGFAELKEKPEVIEETEVAETPDTSTVEEIISFEYPDEEEDKGEPDVVYVEEPESQKPAIKMEEKSNGLSKSSESPKPDNKLNNQTENTNILCLGIADKKLEMISVYSINKENKKSAGIFFPTEISLSINGELKTLVDIYQTYGIATFKKALSQSLLVDIPYYMIVDKGGLIELGQLMGPIYVENEEIDLPNLFVRPVGEKDEQILQYLANEVTKPKMFLQIPKLIKIFVGNVKSDIGLSGLRELYHMFGKLDHSELGKIVLWGTKVERHGQHYKLIDPYKWHNVIYEMTK